LVADTLTSRDSGNINNPVIQLGTGGTLEITDPDTSLSDMAAVMGQTINPTATVTFTPTADQASGMSGF